jgi:hypothetical protein
MRKFFVLCAGLLNSTIKTCLPVIARDQQQAIRVAKATGLYPYGVIAGKPNSLIRERNNHG